MSRRGQANQPPGLRRFGAVVALLGLIFASTIASISHSIAMPVMASPVLQGADQGQPAAYHKANIAHDCESDAKSGAAQQKPATPCEEGCMLCKDCTITTFLLVSPIGIQMADRYGTYEPAVIHAMTSITPPSPNEPPRI